MIQLEIMTHDGRSFIEQVEHYDAATLNEQINDNALLTIVIGKRIISRIKIAEVSILAE